MYTILPPCCSSFFSRAWRSAETVAGFFQGLARELLANSPALSARLPGRDSCRRVAISALTLPKSGAIARGSPNMEVLPAMLGSFALRIVARFLKGVTDLVLLSGRRNSFSLRRRRFPSRKRARCVAK